MRKKSILVTGSSGFIGSHLIDKIPHKTILFGKKDNLLSREKVLQTKRVDVVIHLASKIPQSNNKGKEGFFENNVLGTLNILEYCVKKRVEKLIFISSSIYGKPQYNPVNEKHPILHNNPYTKSKILGEELCKIYAKEYGLKIIILRLANVFGKGLKSGFLISNLYEALENNKPIKIINKKSKRDFIFVDDVVDVILLMIDYECDFEIFNVGSGKSYSFQKILQIFEKIYDVKLDKSFEENKANFIPKMELDISKIKQKTKWYPKISLEEGLKKYYSN